MKKLTNIFLTITCLHSFMAIAASDESAKTPDKENSYHPAEASLYEDSFHVVGINYRPTDRAIASEGVVDDPAKPALDEKGPRPWVLTEKNVEH